MTNMQAALGLAQMEQIESFLETRAQIMSWYAAAVNDFRPCSPKPDC